MRPGGRRWTGLALALSLAPAAAAAGTAAGDEADRGPAVWRPSEFAFTAERVHERPHEVDLVAEFLGPGGETYRVPGFWDGGAAWKVRFAPTAPGPWTYETSGGGGDPGLARRKGTDGSPPRIES